MRTWIAGDVKREPCDYCAQLELLSFEITNGVMSEALKRIPFQKGASVEEIVKTLSC